MTHRSSWYGGLQEGFWGAWPPGNARTSLQEGSLPTSCLYFIGLQDDGNGNSRAQPPQQRDLNGTSPSHFAHRLPTLRKTYLQAFSTQLCLSSINGLETTLPFSQCFGGHVPWEVSPPRSPVPHAHGWHCRARAQGPSCTLSSLRFQVRGALMFHSQLMTGGKFSAPNRSGCRSSFQSLPQHSHSLTRVWGVQQNFGVSTVCPPPLSASAPLRDS